MDQGAIGIEYESVVAAAQLLHITATLANHLGALVAAAVEQNVNLSVTVPDHDDRLLADTGCEIVTRLFYLAVMAHVDPGLFSRYVPSPGQRFSGSV